MRDIDLPSFLSMATSTNKNPESNRRRYPMSKPAVKSASKPSRAASLRQREAGQKAWKTIRANRRAAERAKEERAAKRAAERAA